MKQKTWQDWSEEINRSFQSAGIYSQLFGETSQLGKQLLGPFDFANRLNASLQIPKFDFNIPKIDTSAILQAVKVSDQIAELLKPSFEWREEFSKTISTLVMDLPSPVELFTANLVAFDLSAFALPMREIFRDLFRSIEENEEIAEAFKRCGWPLAPSMPNELRERVVQLYQQDKSRYVSNVILGHYHRSQFENLVKMVESWRTHPLFSSRMHIIDDALEAHKTGKYTLSLPSLLPLIEGILNEYVTRNKLPARCGNIRKVYEAVIGDVDNYSLTTWAIVQTLRYQLENSTYTYTKFEQELKKSPNGRLVSRHTVLHGISTNYHKPSNSLKVFVLLDAISSLHDEIE